MENYETDVLARLRAAIGNGKHPGPVAEREIIAAEKTLGVRFPTSYRVFLQHLGAVWLPASYAIAGLGPGRSTDPEPPLWEHVVDVTLRLRRASRGLIPFEYVRISDDGGDLALYLDTDRWDVFGECPVIELGPGSDSICIATSFVKFIEGAVAGRF